MKTNRRKFEMETPIEEIKEDIISEESTEESVEEVIEREGTVTNCSMLYVRMAGHKNGSPIGTINDGEKVKVIGEANENGFYAIKTSNGTEGFVMSDFISIK